MVKWLRTEELCFLHYSFDVVWPLGERFVQQGLGLLLGHGVLQTHRGQNSEGLGVGTESLIDVIGHAHCLTDAIGRQVTVDQS